MEFTTYTRKPFTVEAIEITTENIADLASLVGELGTKEEDGTPFIQVDPHKVRNVWRVYPGFFLVKMGRSIRCYSPKAFKAQFELAE